ncbi:excalibur calcium-binding domain-containing protein [Paucibacter sp. AS339]|uniref:excalibur calcium-binding domain-containing protein n=1 Tax=Paucibacter hankyongi TaxID=3133434 RepID=UPI0030A4B4D1
MAVDYLQRIAISLTLLVLSQLGHGANAVHKCVINGTVTFQSSPCPADAPLRRPTKDELNAERKKRLSDAAVQSASAPPASVSPSYAGPRQAEERPSTAPPRDPGFRCDGRQHCSQMRSCNEARYFLANCPGVKMDGNHDGVPCEQQWCTHPLAK